MKRARCAGLLLLLFLIGGVAGQAPPKLPEDGARAVEELLMRCLEAGAVRPLLDPKTKKPVRDANLGTPWLEITDAGKLRATIAANRDLMHLKGRHALTGVAKLSEAGGAPALIHILRIVGEETKDDVTREVAAHLAAQRGLPQPTATGQEHLKELVRLGVEGGALRVDSSPGRGRSRLTVVDAVKLRALLSANRRLLSLDLLDTAVAVSRRGVDHAELLRAIGTELNDPRAAAFAAYFLGLRARDDGTPDEAVRQLEDAVRRFDRLRDTPWKAQALVALGRVVQRQSDLDGAREQFQEAARILRVVHGGRHRDLALVLNDLASVHTGRGEYQRALFFQLQAASVLQATGDPDPADVAAFLHQFAFIASKSGDLQEARVNFEHALQIFDQVFGRDSPESATCLKNLGHVYFRQGQYARARALFDRALAIRLDRYGRSHPEVAHSLMDQAMVLAVQGEPGLALFCQQQAVAIFLAAYGPRHPRVAEGYRELGGLYMARGQPARALKYIDQALGLLAVPGKTEVPVVDLTAADYLPTPTAAGLLKLRGDMLRRLAGQEKGRERELDLLRQSERFYASTAELLERVRAAMPGEADKIQAGEDVFACFPLRLGVLRRLHELDGDSRHLRAAFAAAEQGTARVFVETFGDAVARALGGVSPELQARERDLLERIHGRDKELARLYGQADQEAGERQKQVWDQRRELDQELGKVRKQMSQESPRYASARSSTACTLAEARACLAADEVALVFAWHEETAYVVLVEGRPRPDDPAEGLAIVPLDARKAAAKVNTLTSPATLENSSLTREVGADAFALLLGPLADRLRGKHLVIVPAGPVCLLPFEVLVEGAGDNDDGHFLIERHRIRYAPSLTVLHLLKQARPKAEARWDIPFWAVGDPVYEASPRRAGQAMDVKPEGARETFTRLEQSGKEVRAIGRLLGAKPEHILTRADATETRVKAASASGLLARARYVHFATHGLGAPGRGRLPCLVLGQAGGEEEDGFLELDEVAHLRLNADLVVLSACESGRGSVYDGEGMVGLTRSFLYAGSRRVVCSLWKVEEETTAELMQALYAALQAGRPVPLALDEARRLVFNKGKAPLYWAPFVYIGE
jgi:CHAT domain-containing protein